MPRWSPFFLFSPQNMFLSSPSAQPHSAPPPLASTSHGPGYEPSNRKAVIYNSHGSRPWRRYTVSIRRLLSTLVAADSLQCVFSLQFVLGAEIAVRVRERVTGRLVFALPILCDEL